jgi:hypothetical protein
MESRASCAFRAESRGITNAGKDRCSSNLDACACGLHPGSDRDSPALAGEPIAERETVFPGVAHAQSRGVAQAKPSAFDFADAFTDSESGAFAEAKSNAIANSESITLA